VTSRDKVQDSQDNWTAQYMARTTEALQRCVNTLLILEDRWPKMHDDYRRLTVRGVRLAIEQAILDLYYAHGKNG